MLMSITPQEVASTSHKSDRKN